MNSNRLYVRSSSFKMALLFTGLLSAAVLSLGWFLYDFGRQGYQRDSEAALDTEIASILMESRLSEGQTLASIVASRADDDRGIHYLLTDALGNWVAGDMRAFPASVDRIAEGVVLFSLANGSPGESIKVAAKIHTFPNGEKLMVARDIDDIARRFARLRLLSVLSIGCMLLVILVSFLISLFVVSRINRMSDTALEIMETGDLSRRLAVDSRWDDLSHLSRVLNEMLNRIEGLVAGVRQVSDNIAHDLRTPLTRLRNRLEDLRGSEGPAEAIESVIEEADQILATFQSLLRISRMEAGKERHAFSEVDPAAILKDVCELYQPIAHEKGLLLEYSPAPVPAIRADRNLLFQALVNVVDNACKYADSGAAIRCAVSGTPGDGVEFSVTDGGPGIPDNEKERVLERFYRIDSSRSTKGSGLGLSMVAAILRLHRGRILLEDAEPSGLRVRLQLPSGMPNLTES